MATLFAVALASIVWQATRIEPPRRPGYETVVRAGEQLFPIGVPAITERHVLGGLPSRRVDALLAVSVRPFAPPDEVSGGESSATCDLFVRVSRSHWRHHLVTPGQLTALGGEVPSSDGPGAYRLLPPDAVDDDDGDGRLLDAGELRPPTGAGVQVEVHCPPDADEAPR